MPCPRCGGPTEPERIDELVVHFHCADPECSRAHPLYQGEHPLKFWALFTVEVSTKVAKLLYHLARRSPWLMARLLRWFAKLGYRLLLRLAGRVAPG